MAKITLTIEDNPNGLTVKVTSDPSFSAMTERSFSGAGITHAEGYAISALLHLRKCADSPRKAKGKSQIIVPNMRS